jgi:hypothetical protein
MLMSRIVPFALFAANAEIQSLSERSGHSASRAYRAYDLQAGRDSREGSMSVSILVVDFELLKAQLRQLLSAAD